MEKKVVVSSDVACPGCHFRCKLAKYQCGRGQGFYELVAAGEELPERRGHAATGERADEKGNGRFPSNARVMHSLNILSNRVRDCRAETGERKLVLMLLHLGLFVSASFMPRRMSMSAEEFNRVLATALERGLVEEVTDERRVRIVRLTEAGKRQAAIWSVERDARTAEFLSPLSDEEKETLEGLVRKLIHSR